jgi:formylglycine-generating enzyme required for sulfatase activity/uncharacterized protein YceK
MAIGGRTAQQEGSPVYVGTRTCLEMVFTPWTTDVPLLAPVAGVVDLPFSLVADTILLPSDLRGEPAGPPAVDELRVDERATPEERLAEAARVEALLPAFRSLGLRTYSCGGRTFEVAVYLHEPTGLEFSLVPAGSFRRLAGPDAPREVVIQQRLLVARTECTQAAWARVMGGGAEPGASTVASQPVRGVSQAESREFCRRSGLRLPTGDEWEWACRAGTVTRFSFGDDEADFDRYAWNFTERREVQPVGGKRPNAFGLHDVHGNVAEWCADEEPGQAGPRADAAPAGAPASPGLPSAPGSVAPVSTGARARAMVRGGSWGEKRQYQQSRATAFEFRDEGHAAIGFRPVVSVPEE